MGHAQGVSVARRSPKRPVTRSPTRALVPLQPPDQLLAHRGRYHTDRQPGAALQNTAMCPAAPPPARSRAAMAGGQSHSTHDTVIRPGPHSYPFWQRSG
jgi:hypothetical protein